jgi:UDP-glucose 4-epimerase
MRDHVKQNEYKRILVVGGCGFIGRHLVEDLLKSGTTVRILDRVKPAWIDERIEFFEGDFTAVHYLEHVMDGCDAVFHLASTTLPASSNDDPAFDISSNLSGAVALLDLAVKKKVKRFIFASSGGTVYGIPAAVPVPENHPTHPLCSYGIVKLAIEKYLRLYHELYGLNTCSLRLANPYGEYQRADKAQGVIAVFCDKALRGQTIDIWGDGTVVRDFIYIGDATHALIKALYADCSGIELNVGAGVGASLNQLLEHIEAILERPVKRNYLSKRSFDIPEIYLDIQAANQLIGWAPSEELSSGIRKMIDWLSKKKQATDSDETRSAAGEI